MIHGFLIRNRGRIILVVRCLPITSFPVPEASASTCGASAKLCLDLGTPLPCVSDFSRNSTDYSSSPRPSSLGACRLRTRLVGSHKAQLRSAVRMPSQPISAAFMTMSPECSSGKQRLLDKLMPSMRPPFTCHPRNPFSSSHRPPSSSPASPRPSHCPPS